MSEKETQPAIYMRGVQLDYHKPAHTALDNINLTIAPGEFVYLIGRSGSGKSSLLKLLYAELTPSAGKLEVAGVDLVGLKRKKVQVFRRRLGVVFQDFKLLENLSVYQQIEFALTVLGMRDRARERVPEVLELVGLADKADRLPHQLSGGETQRVALARAIADQPQILIADEPTGNLDPKTGDAVIAVLEKLNQLGTTTIVATHNLALVDSSPHRAISLHEGKLAEDTAFMGQPSAGKRRAPGTAS